MTSEIQNDSAAKPNEPRTDSATFASALFAFLALPGIVAFTIPIVLGLVDPWAAGLKPWGIPLIVVGLALLVRTAYEFYRAGKGTLGPWDPPRRLVMSGPFGWCRNPMYVAVACIFAGWALTFASPIVAVYAFLTTAMFHYRVVTGEEVWAAETFPEDWPGYVERVNRWLPRPPR